MATAGYVNPMSEFSYNGRQVVGGMAWRFAQKLIENGGGLVEASRCNVSFNPEIYKLTAQQLLNDAGVVCYMNTVIIDCTMENDRVSSVVVSNKSGICALEADYFIDATGDADLCAMAGVEFLPQVEAMQPGCITVNMTRSAMNAVDSEDYQQAEYKMRRDVFRLVELMREHVEEFKNCYITAVATVAGIRESRRISSDYEAFAAIRVQAPCMETGQAAGYAAAMCLKNGKQAVQDIDTAELVRQVHEAGSFV